MSPLLSASISLNSLLTSTFAFWFLMNFASFLYCTRRRTRAWSVWELPMAVRCCGHLTSELEIPPSPFASKCLNVASRAGSRSMAATIAAECTRTTATASVRRAITAERGVSLFWGLFLFTGPHSGHVEPLALGEKRAIPTSLARACAVLR